MVWRSTSLRYETGEKKLNEVDFISQGVKLVSRIPTTMTKSGVEFNLRIGKGWIKGDCGEDYIMVVKEIEGGLLEEIEVSHFGKEVMILEWMSCAFILVVPTFLVFQRSFDDGLSKTLMVRKKMIIRRTW
nr:hypothetical protein [Tanacetum cinerariifolium]